MRKVISTIVGCVFLGCSMFSWGDVHACGCYTPDTNTAAIASHTHRLHQKARQSFREGKFLECLVALDAALSLEGNEDNPILLYDHGLAHRALGNKDLARDDFLSVMEYYENFDANPPLYTDAILSCMSVTDKKEIAELKRLFELYKANCHLFPTIIDTDYGIEVRNLSPEMNNTAAYEKIVDYLSIGGMVRGCKDCIRRDDGVWEIHFKRPEGKRDSVTSCQDNCDSAAVVANMGCSACPDKIKAGLCVLAIEILRRGCKDCCYRYYRYGNCDSRLNNHTPDC